MAVPYHIHRHHIPLNVSAGHARSPSWHLPLWLYRSDEPSIGIPPFSDGSLQMSRLDRACNGEIIVGSTTKQETELPEPIDRELLVIPFVVLCHGGNGELLTLVIKENPKKLYVDRRLCRRGCGKTSTTRVRDGRGRGGHFHGCVQHTHACHVLDGVKGEHAPIGAQLLFGSRTPELPNLDEILEPSRLRGAAP